MVPQNHLEANRNSTAISSGPFSGRTSYFFPRPARSSHKSGRVERHNAVFNLVFDRISRESTSASLLALVQRASFLRNMFHGNATLFSFRLVRGYSPSVIGIPSTIVPHSLLDAHIEISATRALQTRLKEKSSSPVQHRQLAPGMRVWVFNKTNLHTSLSR